MVFPAGLRGGVDSSYTVRIMKQEPSTRTHTDSVAEDALFSGEVSAIALTLYENERPPRGLAGILDWYCFGKISDSIRSGTLTGKLGECSYFPFTRKNQTYHLFFVGVGSPDQSGAPKTVPVKALEHLQKNLVSMKLKKVGISKSDFGGISEDHLTKHLKGVPLWITA